MQNLIFAIIAIGIGVYVTISGAFFGGQTMTDGKVDAEATRYRNEAIQISSAVRLYRSKGNQIVDGFSLQDLVDKGFLSSLPKGWEPGSNSIIKKLDKDDNASEEICFQANRQSGFTFLTTEENVQEYSLDPNYAIPFCDKENLDNQVSCCIQKEDV